MIDGAARYPLCCPHCLRARSLAKPHCEPNNDGRPRCDWIVCPCGARIVPGGKHMHTNHNTKADDCKTPAQKEPK